MKRALRAALCLFSTALSAPSLDLTVNVRGIQTDRPGKLVLHLWDDSGGFPKGRLATFTLAAPPDAPSKTFVFSNLKPGVYAGSAFHDENTNGKLDFRVLIFPTEGAGFTGTKTPTGPPQFKDYHLHLKQAGQTAEIRLKYPK